LANARVGIILITKISQGSGSFFDGCHVRVTPRSLADLDFHPLDEKVEFAGTEADDIMAL
jgi:hypothetical protein